jgi:hypothetical protein
VKPFLLLDVDGVLSPYPECPDGYTEYDFFPEDDEPVRLAAVHAGWLRELERRFALVWATGWGDEANALLCPFFELPELPVIRFPPIPFEPSAKVPAIDAFVGSRPAAWVDDVVTPEARLWAGRRRSPTLLVETDHTVGLTRDAVDSLFSWLEELSAGT